MEYIVTFHTRFDALQYERFLKKEGIKGKLQPVPRALSSSCGTCVKFAAKEPAEENPKFVDHEFEKLFAVGDDGYVFLADGDADGL